MSALPPVLEAMSASERLADFALENGAAEEGVDDDLRIIRTVLDGSRDAQAYLEKTIDNVEDLEVNWTNDEVLEVVRDVLRILQGRALEDYAR